MNPSPPVNIKSRGTAIFMALLMIAIVAAIAVTLARLQRIDIRRTQMMITSEQGYLYAQGVVDWGISALESDLKSPLPDESWPLVLPSTPTPDGQGRISGILQDAEGLFNINNLAPITYHSSDNSPDNNSSAGAGTSADQKPGENTAISSKYNKTGLNTGSVANSQTLFINLLNILPVHLSSQQQLALVAAIQDWISAQDNTSSSAGFDSVYAQMNPPYQAPHKPMASISELRTVAGITPNIYNQLLPYIVALPVNTNVNSSRSPRVIKQALGLAADTKIPDSAQSPSEFFLLRADVILHDQHIVLFSMLNRINNPQKPQVKILWQSLGTE